LKPVNVDVTAVEPGEADLDASADPGDFGGLDEGDAGLQAALTVLAVLADDISDAAEVTDGLEVPGALECRAAQKTPGTLRRVCRRPRRAARTRRSSSSVTTMMTCPPHGWRSAARRRTRSRTISSRSARSRCSTPSRS